MKTLTIVHQAIETKYHGPTNHNGSRFTVKCEAGRITVPYDHALNLEDNHQTAAMALADKLKWNLDNNWAMVGGSTSTGYAWIIISLPLLKPHLKGA